MTIKMSQREKHKQQYKSKKQNLNVSKLAQYRGHIGAVGKTFSLYKSIHSQQLVDVEEEFLHAAEFGDIPTVRRLLAENVELNVDCIDALGRTALRLAVKNEHLEVSNKIRDKYCFTVDSCL